jgi:integrase
MSRPRKNSNGLPHYVYERMGKLKYSIGFKSPNGLWLFKYACLISNGREIRELRGRAIEEAGALMRGTRLLQTISDLMDAWLTWQRIELSPSSVERRAETTLAENAREIEVLRRAFGHIPIQEFTKTHGYEFLDACAKAGRPAKANKEIALLRLILEWSIRKGLLASNPLDGVRKNKIRTTKRYVSDAEIQLALDVGRVQGGSQHIVALGLMTAYLSVKRSVEVRGLTLSMLTERGILWRDGKDINKPAVLIEWSPALRSVIGEALASRKTPQCADLYIFGNQKGNRYTKGGWKAVLHDLMTACRTEAEKCDMPFEAFSLQDCRPKGVSDKLASGQLDTQDATGHTSERMIRQTYDRRPVKIAKPVK